MIKIEKKRENIINKIDEKISELAEKKFAYEDTVRNTKDKALIKQAREEYFQAGLIVKKLKEQLEVVSQINEGEGDLLNGLSDEEKVELEKLNKLIKGKEKYVDDLVDDYKKEIKKEEEKFKKFKESSLYTMYPNDIEKIYKKELKSRKYLIYLFFII